MIEFLFFLRNKAFSFLKKRSQIKSLVRSDFREQYNGTYLGIYWSIIRPVLFVMVIWTVFEFGFKSSNVEGDYPFGLWLLTGLLPWLYFSDYLPKGANVFIQYKYLLKKIGFDISLLPIVKVLSTTIVHIVLMALLVLIYLYLGFDIKVLSFVYYFFCLLYFSLSIGLLCAVIRVFIKDINEIIGVTIQFCFWITPIIWSSKNINENVELILSINPMNYIVNGYRDSFLAYEIPNNNILDDLFFFSSTTLIMTIAIKLFRKTKVQFLEVLS